MTNRPLSYHDLPNLTISRSEARKKIKSQIQQGQEILNRGIHSEDQLGQARVDLSIWTKYNHELLLRIFDSPVKAQEYVQPWAKASRFDADLYELVGSFKQDVKICLTRLEALYGSLELIPEPKSISSGSPQRITTKSDRVFIVHGHDEAAKQSVARFIENLGLKAVILHEQANKGRTLIEKFEDYSDVGYAIVLLTPDDVGGRSDKPKDLSNRARQNVIFELGFFIGKLGRERVFALYKGELELPTDFIGVVYELMDSGEGWKRKLAKELMEIGYEIDIKKVL